MGLSGGLMDNAREAKRRRQPGGRRSTEGSRDEGGELAGDGDEGAGGVAVGEIVAAVLGDEVAFLDPGSEEDVGGDHDGEEEVSEGHGGRGPEGDEEAEHEGMADEFVEPDEPEADGAVGSIAEAEPDLSEAEEVEVADHEGGEEDDGPAEE